MDKLYITRASDAFQHYPAEDRDYHFGLQVHWAMVAHGDLRFEFGSPERVLGITLAIAKPGLRRPRDLQDFREQVEDPDNWKLDFDTGEFTLRRRRSGNQVETYIYGKKKSPEAADWLYRDDFEGDPGQVGATEKHKGFMLLVDAGEIEHLSKKPHAFEYQLHGKTLNGRYLFRQFRGIISRALPEDSKTMYEGQSGFIFIRAKDQTPYVLSNRAIQLRWLPPEGTSALPKLVRNQVPSQLRYWKEPGFEKALSLRNSLRNHLLKEGVIHSTPQEDFSTSEATVGTRFTTSYRSYKGKTKSIKSGHSFAFWNIFVEDGDAFYAFKCWQDPIDNPSISAELQDGYHYRGALEFEGRAAPDHPMNDSKGMECYVERLDQGHARLKEDTQDRKVFELTGRAMRGTYVASKEENSDIWVISRR